MPGSTPVPRTLMTSSEDPPASVAPPGGDGPSTTSGEHDRAGAVSPSLVELSGLQETRELVAPAAEAEAEAEAEVEEGPELELGDVVGRYSVLSLIGRGGMGVVYKAYDPQLDRNVALKLLRRGRSSIKADLRLMREARTLAKLKHPNVVAVYDAGLTSHGVFIAMELVDGQTLNTWLEVRRRRVDEILAVFRAAGCGLLAAHQAGFVHRDFKPSNVIVGDDGMVRVLDFGLAHLVDEDEPPDEQARSRVVPRETEPRRRTERPSGPGRRVDTREVFSTEAGAVMGTPAFMAPEQILDGQTDQRSEQFSFAMSLYVVLYDRSPLGGETYQERRESIAAGLQPTERDLETSAHGERVPPRVRQVILRGLAISPEDRFGSMEEMLALLEPSPHRWGSAVAAFTLLLGFGVGAAVFGESSDSPCTDPAGALEGAWGPADRDALAARFARHGQAEVELSWRRIEQTLDDYAGDWVRVYAESCRATFVERQQTEQLFDQRMRCLVRRRNRLRSTIDALVETEDEQQLIQRTILAYKLPSIDACSDLDYVTAERPPPDDPITHERVAALRLRIDDADTRTEAGDFGVAAQELTAVVAEARELDYAPVLGEALQSLGRAQVAGRALEPDERTFAEAIRVAERVADDRTAAAAWTGMVFAQAHLDPRGDVSILELAAQAAVERAGDDMLRSWLLNELGVLHGQRGELDVALGYLRQALDAKRTLLGEQHVDVGISCFNLGNALAETRAYGEAAKEFTRAHAIFEATVGAAHPMTHVAQRGLCRAALGLEDARLALESCRAAIADYDAASPEWLARTQLLLAQAQWLSGDHEGARATAQAGRAQRSLSAEVIEEFDRWLEDPAAFDEFAEPVRAGAGDKGDKGDGGDGAGEAAGGGSEKAGGSSGDGAGEKSGEAAGKTGESGAAIELPSEGEPSETSAP
ncbi:MAG: serine/threonine protein kinase [Myxococcales bacterium]|nr:serine/threonine protein kinase [Myxococcales bacterium]